ncbi:MAG: tyrosine-type recombinase/integrase [Chloroflexi bacterium]|nr:tyrosine-type recombinase/integrase [Chloroflexota bacterium]
MPEPRWDRYPLVTRQQYARSWLTIQANLGLAPATVTAYGHALEDFLAFSARCEVSATEVSKAHIAAYVNDLATRAHPSARSGGVAQPTRGLANATLQQRLTAVRLYHDYLMEEGLRPDNPVGRGRYTPGKSFGGQERGLLARFRKLPWIPTDEQWHAILQAARTEPLRNRLMLAMAYDAGLRRQEVCTLTTGDIDPSARLLSIRAERTKGRRERVIPYSAATAALFMAYLEQRHARTQARGPLFVSESQRNRGQPISLWTWTKVVERIAERAGVPQFTTHTLRHLCLTDLARAGWALHEIAEFAGHRTTQTTLLYIHLSGRDLAAKLERGMATIHAWRARMAAEVLR